MHEGSLISNNSLLLLDSLGDGNTTDTPLHCYTPLSPCCNTSRHGTWVAPGAGNTPLSDSQDSTGLYQSWGDNQIIRLHRSIAMDSAEGLYHCEVPDRDGVTQRLYVGIYNTTAGEGIASKLYCIIAHTHGTNSIIVCESVSIVSLQVP